MFEDAKKRNNKLRQKSTDSKYTFIPDMKLTKNFRVKRDESMHNKSEGSFKIKTALIMKSQLAIQDLVCYRNSIQMQGELTKPADIMRVVNMGIC